MLSRAQKIPSMDDWMNPKPAGRALTGEEAKRRQEDHDEFAERVRKQLEQEGDQDGD